MAGVVDGYKLVLLSCVFHSVLCVHDLPGFGDDTMRKDHGPWLQLKGYSSCPGALISMNDEAITMNVEKCGYLSGGPLSPKYKEFYTLDTMRFLWCSREKCSDEYQRYHEGTYHRLSGAGNTIEVQLFHKLIRNAKKRSFRTDPDDTAVLVFFFQACLRCQNNEQFTSIVQALTRLDAGTDRSRPTPQGLGEKFRIYDGNWQKFKQKFVPLGKNVLGPEIIPLLSVFQTVITGIKSKMEMPYIHYRANYFDKNNAKYLSHWLVVPRAIPISEQQAYSFALRSSEVPSFKHMAEETSVDGLTLDGYTLYTGTSASKSTTPELEYSRFE